MHVVARVGHRAHPIDRRRYGRPVAAVYWANRTRFAAPGVYLLVLDRMRRILPLPRRTWPPRRPRSWRAW